MIAARNSAFSEKKDLHVGGLGAVQASLAPLPHSTVRAAAASRPLLRKARTAVDDANDALHDNPWAALGLVAALGVTVGYLLSRHSG